MGQDMIAATVSGRGVQGMGAVGVLQLYDHTSQLESSTCTSTSAALAPEPK